MRFFFPLDQLMRNLVQHFEIVDQVLKLYSRICKKKKCNNILKFQNSFKI